MEQSPEPAAEPNAKNVEFNDLDGGGDAGGDGSTGPTGRRESADCSSGESNTRAKRSASATATQFKDSGVGGSGGSSGGSGSGPEDGGQTSAQPPQRAPPVGKAGARGGKHKLARPEGHACCPRCDSENTKFCYYNNYNIKQPRYFCKECQRYWTAGGILRNVPPGSGRRKSKSSAAREQEKAAAAATAKREARVPAASQALPQPALVLPPSMGGGGSGPSGTDGGDGLLPQMNPAYAEQLCYMMDPSLAQMAAAAGMNGMSGMAPLGMAPNMPMGIPGYDPSAGFPGPGGMMAMGPSGMSGGGMESGINGGGGMGGTSRLADGASASLASGGATLSQGAPGGKASSLPTSEDGAGGDGRRVRAKLDHSGLDEPQGSGMSAMGNASVPASGGGEDRHAEWAAAARAAERQQAATMAAQMAAAQAQLQQAAALQAQAHLHAAAASWSQPAGSYGMAGANMWRSAYGYPNPNWAAAARSGGSGSVGSEPSGTGSNGTKSYAGGSGLDGSCELTAGGMTQQTGGWNGMMPMGSTPMGMASWPGAMPWGAPGADMMGGSYPKGFNAGMMMGSNGAAPQGSSMGSGNSANTVMQAPSI